MAVGIMSASLTALCLLGGFLQVFGHGEVFRGAPGAHTVFLRSKRANQFLVEEILQGNLERECYEELCNYEEAREVFENNEKTVAFWTVYLDGDQCMPNPCLNGGNCTDKVGGFSCSCSAPHYGQTCELGALEEQEELEDRVQPSSMPQSFAPDLTDTDKGKAEVHKHELSECPTEGPTACHQLCTASSRSFTCSCTTGFKLQSDGRSCEPKVKFPCGRLPDADALMCRHGNCPWQVSLQNSRGEELCGGVVLGRYAVLTAARCLLLESGSDLRPSDFHVVAGNDKMLYPVNALYLHDRFHVDHHDNDLALIELATPLPLGPTIIHLCLPTRDFSENILMHSGRSGVSARRGRSQNRDLVYVKLEECRRKLNVSHSLSNKMFCMKRLNGAQRKLNALLGNESRLSWKPKDAPSPNRPLENQIQNQTQSMLNMMPNGTENSTSSSRSQKLQSSHGGSRTPCGGPLPGSPVATAEKGTAFLTGLLMSSSASCDGQVFTKVSRYLNWIRPRLQVAEDHMTPQVSEYPDSR
ncbi:protein Z, vitamin K-dependent plasma glycoprotein b [Melanotaenia boesemani]|uniref:protein Z, vitamin K-dependent plasma glycoprotein b n=1 Tax=Melanotaenia boesemani TaxID=1250792 RepID=UPI001C057FE0|nr:protein Z, vitamin K-dependent plasma glycoprotein b [Melanotaenia boesemani]